MIYQRPRLEIPECTWKRPIGLGWDKPYTVRYASNLDDGPWHGMPLGGFGAGCIGRSPRGDFNLWHLNGGEHVFRSLPACQFSVFEQPEDSPAQAYALCTEPPEDGSLSRWQWYPKEGTGDKGLGTGTYHALYPRSWFVYENVFQAELTCEQFSPIWAGNYQETSYPTAVFRWTAYNPTDKPITISIMLTWQNVVGWFTNAIKSPEVRVRDDGSPVYEYQPRWGDSTGNLNQWISDFHRVGCLLDRVRLHDEIGEGEGQLAIATVTNPSLEVFHHSRWDPASDGGDIWDIFACNGTLSDRQDETPAAPGEQIASAIAVRFTLKPGRTRYVPFILCWDFPVMEFGTGDSITKYYRRYTDFFGRNGTNAWSIIRTALKQDDTWRDSIREWQQPILEQQDLPSWFKMALFNELYLLCDGGTLWTAASELDPIGQFGVLECLDYRWYESLDVRLYGSFALAMLWPKLDKAVLEAFARAIPTGDDTPRIIGYNQAQAIRKAANATPHDLGAPNEHPWEKTNYTSYQDCNLWKDLPCDFVLQVYRDFVMTGSTDIQFLGECWDSIVKTLAYVKEFDLDGDGIPENSGAPDQTFDDWRLQGLSAYCGGLWLAALESAIAIGQILAENYPDGEYNTTNYQIWLDQSQSLYQQKLWNGKYYRLDSESGSDIVMADQLCGQFYARWLGLPDIVPVECIQSTLKTVYESCFLKFNNGLLGAANGVKPDGTPFNPNATHPLEVWTGINFGLAAFMVQMGMKDEAFQMTEAVVRQVYDNGLQFRTPEAITAAGTFRASHYLRAMAIWAIYGVLTKF
ncbi:GH116 family glycosyl hydrolase [Funiculus sociatus GB2-A5]|uniref:GH116 family glycosyl hydrolase n=1 Tax=Funiculus sociatus GB2-A5 TaxID=2933946 RepID=A0ABV0JTY5_9CYAN|nr:MULTISPECIES: GH116 family glycosyl hydrolase [unclassified Trichocoleus]MBD1907601.1 bile acid beta-glucosidase [Trichocoleus sp. FACHB-832]MBD2063720.1 bile acid beta-glucosidase [Trichocoleus sp. FACHB-6]